MNVEHVLAIAGATCAGKSTLAGRLGNRPGVEVLRVRDILAGHAGANVTRGDLERLGEALDLEAEGGWLLQAVSSAIDRSQNTTTLVVDSIRTADQLRVLADAIGSALTVVVLTSTTEVRRARFAARRPRRSDDEGIEFDELLAHPRERLSFGLDQLADVTVDTTRLTPAEVSGAVERRLRPQS